MKTRRALVPLAVLAAAATLAGCGGSGSSQPQVPTIQPARTFRLAGLRPAAPVAPGTPMTLGFTINQPNGQPLTRFHRGAGPHNGVHVIVVSDDLSTIIHRHPPVGAGGRISERIVLPKPGTYRVVVDAYPAAGPQRNFQLFGTVRASGTPRAAPLPPFRATDIVDGYRVTLHGKTQLHAIQAAFLTATVADSHGRPARFTPWYGALAHAIFFRRGTLDYFHTHVCAPGASGCASLLGGASVSGTSSTPGKLKIGVLVPVAGTWRLFLQFKVDGHVLTAPYTLTVKP